MEATSRASSALDPASTSRYSRQLLLPGFEVEGQLRLCNSSVIIIGAGGLGCPAGLYLAASGLGKLAFVDFDLVEENNLHRQVLHTESRVGTSKAHSAVSSLRALNSACQYVAIDQALNPENALQILGGYDVVVDASDNAPTRYLVNDACLILGKPLVSASALQWEGQLTVYNYDRSTPCYRCLFPEPPNPALVTNCNDGGVLGAITGIIGALQALEVIGVLLRRPNYAGKMLFFDGAGGSWRVSRLRPRQPDCAACSPKALSSLALLKDYNAFCRSNAFCKNAALSLLDESQRLSPHEYYDQVLNAGKAHVLIDVRPEIQYKISSLSNSKNIPFYKLQKLAQNELQALLDCKQQDYVSTEKTSPAVYFICRRGNESQKAVKLFQSRFPGVPCQDIKGGLEAWTKSIDPTFAIY